MHTLPSNLASSLAGLQPCAVGLPYALVDDYGCVVCFFEAATELATPYVPIGWQVYKVPLCHDGFDLK